MISIIVCSRSINELEAFEKNISETIGIAFELISIDNSQNAYSISQAYNKGAKTARYDLLCFVHEDVAFETSNWGSVLVKILENKEIGVVGVAGGTVKTKATGPCWWSPVENSGRINLVQHYRSGKQQLLYENPGNEKVSQVVVIDGVFMGCRREVFNKHPFDEKTIKGFHFYDFDLSLSIGADYKVVVAFEILLAHFSEGRNDRTWAEQADIVHSKWRSQLPRYTGGIPAAALKKAEIQTSDLYLSILFETGCRRTLIFKYVIRRVLLVPKDFKVNFYFLKKLF